MRFTRLLTFAAIAVTLSVTACAPEQPPVSEKVAAAYEAGKTLATTAARPLAAFIGDSYTQGYGASSKETNWVALVAAGKGWGNDNFGRGGTGYVTNSDLKGCGLAVCPNYQEMVEVAAGSMPAVVVVAGGQNDIPAFVADPARVKAAIRATYADLRAALPNAEIVAVGPSTPFEIDAGVVEFDQVVRDAAAVAGARYVSLIEPEVLQPDMVLSDKAHVNDAGHKAIAERVLATLR